MTDNPKSTFARRVRAARPRDRRCPQPGRRECVVGLPNTQGGLK